MKIDELMKLRWDLATNDDVLIIQNFLRSVKHNQKYENKYPLDFKKVKKSCDNLRSLFGQCLEILNATIPPLKTLDDNFVYSVRFAEKPPFIARTNDPEIIEKIYKLLIRIGGWENAKFLFENLRLNGDDSD